MSDPVGESNANGREFVGLHLVDHSRRDCGTSSVLRHLQWQNDRVLCIANFNGVSSETAVPLTQLGEGDHCITVDAVSERINLLIDMETYYERATLTHEAPDQ